MAVQYVRTVIWVGIVLFFVVVPIATAYQSRTALFLPALLVVVCVQWTIVGDSGAMATACLVLAIAGLAGGIYAGELGRRRRRRIRP
jgi:hypothetical protein